MKPHSWVPSQLFEWKLSEHNPNPNIHGRFHEESTFQAAGWNRHPAVPRFPQKSISHHCLILNLLWSSQGLFIGNLFEPSQDQSLCSFMHKSHHFLLPEFQDKLGVQSLVTNFSEFPREYCRWSPKGTYPQILSVEWSDVSQLGCHSSISSCVTPVGILIFKDYSQEDKETQWVK